MYGKPGCIVKKTPFLQGNTDILNRKQEVLSENSIMYRKSGCIVKKKRFYRERLKFYIENEIFNRRKQYYVAKTRLYS